MTWLTDLINTPSVAQTVLLVAAVAAAGLGLGNITARGVGLGVAGVLFAGLAFGHVLGEAGVQVDGHVLHFVREFGLILFVYAIGIQVGPGFLGSLRREGLPLNLMAAVVVLLGGVLAAAAHFLGGVDFAAVAGIYSGAVTNTPSLAAAQQALQEIPGLDPAQSTLPGMGYAVAYPFGILGIILTMLLVRVLFRVNVRAESDAIARSAAAQHAPLAAVNLEVTNPNLAGLPLAKLPTLRDSGAVVSRLSREGVAAVAQPDTALQLGDTLHVVGPREALDALRLIVGVESKVDVKAMPGDIVSRQVIVTRREPLGKTIDELGLPERFGVTVTRVHRAGIELPVKPGLAVSYADSLVVVGPEAAVAGVGAELGNSQKLLQHPHIIPVFVGIALGVILGSIPFFVPGLPSGVRLGLAGGPLIVAIVLSRVGHIGPLVWYLPISANAMLRELGIALFLAAVGLRAGDGFLDLLLAGDGLRWMAWGAAVTFLPLATVALFARAVRKTNYATLCGLLAGSCTDPPALAFAQGLNASDAPAVSYATVYPLVMVLRVLSAQLLVMLLAS